MISFLKLYLLALPVFFAIDMVWLGVVAKDFYKNQIGFLMRPDVNWFAAVVFYCMFLAGLVVFVIEPALEKKDWLRALWLGGLLGLITYATYDLTNLATLKGWPLKMVIIDMLWGTVLSASVSVITFFLAIRLKI
jgi:uncharacterized membrane protein